MPDDAYDPACISVLAGMEPPRRPAGFVEDDIERRPMGVHDALEAWAEGRLSVERALQLTGAADVAEMIVLCHVNEVARPLLGGPVEARYPVEDGPGSGQRVELSVSVLVGLERSTVIVADPITGRALTREVLPHGREADVAAVAVEAAIRARLPGDPGGVPGAVRKPAGEPRE